MIHTKCVHTSDVTCLVVEDHPLYKDALTRVLRKKTAIGTVLVAESLASAREVITHSHVDLVLMDLHLSDGSALDLLQWLSQRASSLKILFLSAFLNCYHRFIIDPLHRSKIDPPWRL